MRKDSVLVINALTVTRSYEEYRGLSTYSVSDYCDVSWKELILIKLEGWWISNPVKQVLYSCQKDRNFA